MLLNLFPFFLLKWLSVLSLPLPEPERDDALVTLPYHTPHVYTHLSKGKLHQVKSVGRKSFSRSRQTLFLEQMRRFSKASADRVASVRIDLLPQPLVGANDGAASSSSSPSQLSPDLFKALVSSQAVVSALQSSLGLLFGASACAITLSGANIGQRELAVHIHSAGGGGPSTLSSDSKTNSNGGEAGGVSQLRAACALVTTLPLSDRTVGILLQGGEGQHQHEGEEEDDFCEDVGAPQQQASTRGSFADALRPYVVCIGDGEWILPCRLTVSRVK